MNQQIATKRVVKHLKNEHFVQFKKCMMKEFEYSDEQSFYNMALQSMYSKLTEESMTKIKNTAFKLNEEQKESDVMNEIGNINTINPKQKSNILTKLPSDSISNIASFLTQKDGIVYTFNPEKKLSIKTRHK